MKTTRIILLILIAVVAASHQSDGQQARPVAEQLRLAAVMPSGALVYLQARDLSALMKAWLGSSINEKFYKSASFTAFSKSRIYLKFQDRKNDFESALGFGLDEARLAELAGGATAISIYDIGNLELVFTTEVSRERAVATALFKQAPQFQERSSPNGVYYVHDVTTDGGELRQQFCFAHVAGKLVVTTTEGLMVRTLENIKAAGADSLLTNVLATIEGTKGFAAHEFTMWLDQARLNRARHFKSYWIYHNITGPPDSSLANIESGLIDLRITPQGMNEQRWFKVGTGNSLAGRPVAGEAITISGSQASALLRFAPADAQLVKVHAQGSGDELTEAISQALFGKLPSGSITRPEIPDHTRSNSSNEDETATRSERYSKLDTRFDVDVDDEQAPKRGSGGTVKEEGKKEIVVQRSLPDFKSILARLSPAGYSEVVRSKSDAGKPFVRFERAVVIEMKPDAAVDRAAIERAITDEMRARFVIAGIDPKLGWQDEAAVRHLAQSLLEQGAAYSISGKYLVFASNKEFARDILQAASGPAPASAAKIDGALEFYSIIRVAEAKPIFDKLMSKLDGKAEKSAANQDEDEESDSNINFFSDNISSLISASTIREARLHREVSGSIVTERVLYLWQ